MNIETFKKDFPKYTPWKDSLTVIQEVDLYDYYGMLKAMEEYTKNMQSTYCTRAAPGSCPGCAAEAVLLELTQLIKQHILSSHCKK